MQLVELLKKPQIDWSIQISEDCKTFLQVSLHRIQSRIRDQLIKSKIPFQGLLMGNPNDRFEWTTVLNHPFVKDHLIIIEDAKNELPLTNALTESQSLQKEKQRQEIISKNDLPKPAQKTFAQYVTTDDNDSTSSMDSVHAIITTDVENIETDVDTHSDKPRTSGKAQNDEKKTSADEYYGDFMENPNLVVRRYSDNFNQLNDLPASSQANQAAVSPSAIIDMTAALKNTNLAVSAMADNATDYKLSKDNNLEALQRHIAVQQFQHRNRDILARIESQSIQLQRKDLEKRKLSQNLDNFSIRLGNSGAGNELDGSVGKEEPISKSAE